MIFGSEMNIFKLVTKYLLISIAFNQIRVSFLMEMAGFHV